MNRAGFGLILRGMKPAVGMASSPAPHTRASAPQVALAAGQVAELSRLRDEVLAGRDEDDREAVGRGVVRWRTTLCRDETLI